MKKVAIILLTFLSLLFTNKLIANIENNTIEDSLLILLY